MSQLRIDRQTGDIKVGGNADDAANTVISAKQAQVCKRILFAIISGYNRLRLIMSNLHPRKDQPAALPLLSPERPEILILGQMRRGV